MTSPQIDGGPIHRAGDPSNRRRTAPRANGDRGVALVEFALIMPVLAMILLGTVTAGFALNQKQQITHAVREGARYAASISPTQTFVGQDWDEAVRQMVVERSAGDLTTGQVCVSLVSGSPGVVVPPANVHSTEPGGAPCIANQTYPTTPFDTGVRVQVTGTREVKIEFMLANMRPTIAAKATAKSETGT